MKLRPQQRSGLTRWEVTALAMCGVALLLLMAALILPSLARTGRPHRPHASVCRSNLKQVAWGFLIWANDHEEIYPFTATNADSSLAWANSPEVFRHFLVMSNELVTPKVLFCPADVSRHRATDWTNFSNASLSYFVSLDARHEASNSILNGDRNITGGTLSNGFLRVLTPGDAARWTKEMHQHRGHLSFADNSVQMMTNAQLQKHFATLTNQTIRLAVP